MMADDQTPVVQPFLKARRTDEIGSTGLVRYGDTVDEEWHRLLQGVNGVRAYREMRDNDATVGASFYAITSLTRQVEWTVQRADETPQAEEAALFVESCMSDMSHTWDDMITEVLSMLTFGWANLEKVYKRRLGASSNPTRNSKFDDGRFGWRKISIRAQETLDGWEFGDEGQIEGMYQRAAPNYGRVFIPSSKTILFRTQRNKNNPEGRSLLRNAWRSWFFLKRMQEIEAIGIERDLVGLPVIHLPFAYMDPKASDDKKQALGIFSKLLQQIRRNEHEGVVFPAELDSEGNPTGFKLSLLSTGGSRQLDIRGTIVGLQKQIAQTMLTQFLFLGMDSVGSFSLSSDMTDIFAVSLGALLDNIEETFDRFGTQELMAINGFPPETWPRIVHGDIEKPKLESTAGTLMNLVSAGLISPDDSIEDKLREDLHFPPRDVENEPQVDLEPEAADDQQEASDEEEEVS